MTTNGEKPGTKSRASKKKLAEKAQQKDKRASTGSGSFLCHTEGTYWVDLPTGRPGYELVVP